MSNHLDSIETVIKFAQTLTFKGKQPVVKLIEKVYQKGVKLTSKEMEEVEKKIKRLPHLSKWFVEIIGYST